MYRDKIGPHFFIDHIAPEKCPAIIKVQILYEVEDGGD